MNRLLVSFFVLAMTQFTSSSAADRDVQVHRDLVYATIEGQQLKVDLHVPQVESDKQKPPLLIWIHGGGWRAGSKNKSPLRDIVADGYALASIQYRFTDKALFPAQIHDCKGAVRWLRANAETYGYDANWIAVAGSSAGGHLALLLGTSGDVADLEGDVGANLDRSSLVQAVVDFFGPSDFVLRGKTQPGRAYTEKSGSFALLGGLRNGKIDPHWERMASPAMHVGVGDPPLLIFHGDKDETVLLDQSERIAAVYEQAGLNSELVVIQGAGHGGGKFYQQANLDRIRTFLAKCRASRSDP